MLCHSQQTTRVLHTCMFMPQLRNRSYSLPTSTWYAPANKYMYQICPANHTCYSPADQVHGMSQPTNTRYAPTRKLYEYYSQWIGACHGQQNTCYALVNKCMLCHNEPTPCMLCHHEPTPCMLCHNEPTPCMLQPRENTYITNRYMSCHSEQLHDC